MPLSNAEKQRRYRARRNADRERLEENKKKDRERYHKKVADGRIKLVADMTEREKRKQRKAGKEKSRRRRQRLKTEMQMITPPSTPQSSNNIPSPSPLQESRQRAQARRKKNRDKAECYRKIKTLEKALEQQKRLAERYKKRHQRLSNKHDKHISDLTPKSKSKKFLRVNLRNPAAIKRTLTFHYSLTADLKERYAKTKTHREKENFKRFLSGKYLTKYRLCDNLRKSVGVGRICMKRTRPLRLAADSLLKCVKSYYERDDVSRNTTGKKETMTYQKIKKQKRFLLDNMKTLHRKFLAENPTRNISYSLFCKLRPFWVLIPRASDRDTCLCKIHDNVAFMANKLHQLKLIRSVNLEELAEGMACDHKNKTCMYNECMSCNMTDAPVAPPPNGEENTFWWEWTTKKEERENGQGKVFSVQITVKHKQEGTITELVSKFQDGMKKMKKHVFNIRNQYSVYRELRQNMKNHECILHIDFAENYLCKYGSEIQSVHFGSSHKQASLHTGVIYFGGEINTVESFCTISDASDHCPEAIWAYLDPVLSNLREEHPEITTVHVFSDSPATQYRQKKNFFLFCTEIHSRGFTLATWNFFESAHGKGAPDGVGGALKRSADRLVAEGKDVSHPLTLFQQLRQTSSVNLYYVSSDVVRKSIVDFNQTHSKLKAITGTTRIHQLITHSKGAVLFRDVSCACSPQNQYLCECYPLQSHSFSEATELIIDEHIPPFATLVIDTDESLVPEATNFDAEVLRPITFWSPALVGKHCVVNYQDTAYPGTIINTTDEDVQVECMKVAGSNRFCWPTQEDICWYPFKHIITLIDDLIPVSRRHFQIDPKIWSKIVEYMGN